MPRQQVRLLFCQLVTLEPMGLLDGLGFALLACALAPKGRGRRRMGERRTGQERRTARVFERST